MINVKGPGMKRIEGLGEPSKQIQRREKGIEDSESETKAKRKENQRCRKGQHPFLTESLRRA